LSGFSMNWTGILKFICSNILCPIIS
jgi:hypothetical protein